MGQSREGILGRGPSAEMCLVSIAALNPLNSGEHLLAVPLLSLGAPRDTDLIGIVCMFMRLLLSRPASHCFLFKMP